VEAALVVGQQSVWEASLPEDVPEGVVDVQIGGAGNYAQSDEEPAAIVDDGEDLKGRRVEPKALEVRLP
jgi:hypothetical protein